MLMRKPSRGTNDRKEFADDVAEKIDNQHSSGKYGTSLEVRRAEGRKDLRNAAESFTSTSVAIYSHGGSSETAPLIKSRGFATILQPNGI